MTESPFVPIEEAMRVLELTKRQVYNDISKQRIPGYFRVTGKKNRKPYIPRHEWNQFLRGEWAPRQNVSFLQRVKSGSVA